MAKDSAESSAMTPASSTAPVDEKYESSAKPLQFWLVFLGASVATFLSALELTSVGTALPTIVADLQGSDFIWVGSAYSLASSAFMPASGGLSNIFGRRAIMMVAIAFFAAGSAIAGAAQSMNMLIAARAIQGAGGGSIISMTEIIVADLVPLRERGKFGGIIGAVWALASVLGPPIGGALATGGQWRWLFYLNLPLSGIAGLLVFLFLHMKTPEGSTRDKLRQIDWTGNAIIIPSTAAAVLALTWGGVQYAWNSYHVLLPLILGLVGLLAFFVYEVTLSKNPIVPRRLVNNRTTLLGFLATFFHGVGMTLVVYYLPTYFQGSKGASAIRSGVLLFPSALIVAPLAIITGQSIERTGKYIPQNYIGWMLGMIGYGTMSMLTEKSNTAMGEGLQIVGGMGFGMLYVAPQFSILAPLDVEDNAHALALMSYVRTFGQTFGVTLGTTIIQNGLKSRLPSDFLAQFPTSTEISYAIIPIIKTLDPATKHAVQKAFANSIQIVWYYVVGVAGAGLLSTIPMKALHLSTSLDENWGLERAAAGGADVGAGADLEANVSSGAKPSESVEGLDDKEKVQASA